MLSQEIMMQSSWIYLIKLGQWKNMHVSSDLREIHHLSKSSSALGLLLPSLPPSTASSFASQNQSAYNNNVNSALVTTPDTK